MSPAPFAFTMVLLGLPAALTGAPPGDGRGDWPQFLGPARNGVYDGPPLRDSFGGGKPPLIWKRGVGSGFSGPVVSGGKLIIFHRVGDRETVECLEAGTGGSIWSFDYPTAFEDSIASDDGPRATPAISGDRVFTFGAEGVLTCLELSSGKRRWSADTRRAFAVEEGYFGAASSPLIEGGRLLLNIGGRQGAGIVAFEAETGKTLWTATDDRASHSSGVAATIAGKRQAFFFTRSGLAVVDPASGEVRHQFPWRARIAASATAATPLVIGDLVFISGSYQIGAAVLRVKEGGLEKVWSSDDVLSCHYATSVHRDGFLFGFDGRQEASPNLRCVELATGKVRWSVDRFGAGTAILAGDRLLILTEGGELVLGPASPEEWKPLVRARVLEGTVRAHPALAGGRLFARDGNSLVCLDLRSKG